MSLAAGADFAELHAPTEPHRRTTPRRSRSWRRRSASWTSGWARALGGQTAERVFYGGERTPTLGVLGATEQFADVNFVKLVVRPLLHRVRSPSAGGASSCSATTRIRRCSRRPGSIRSARRSASARSSTPSSACSGSGRRPFPQADDFVVIPQTTHQVVFSTNATTRASAAAAAPQSRSCRSEARDTRPGASAEVEEIMRIRHGLKLDEPNDFEIGGQDAILRLWDQISRAVFLALVVISSVALMVGGIGVMAIMMISVTERTREIGVRKALGARRQEILFQFLSEAAVLTSVGGVLGILCGSGIGVAISFATGFPISLPWWSFAIGLGFSAGVGIFFGMVPAVRASRLDPIEALRHE